MRAALVLLCVLGVAVAFALAYENRLGRDVRGSSTVEFVPAEPLVQAPRRGLPWPMFGRTPARTAATRTAIRPPFRRLWVTGGRALIEFPPALAYGRLYYADGGGRVYAVSARTGRRLWRFDAHRGEAATPAVAGGTVFEAFLGRLGRPANRADDGELVALDARTGAVRWKTAVGASETSPLVCGGRVYVGGWDGAVYALSARTGRRLWRFGTGGAVKGGIAASGGIVVAGSYDGHVYALAAGSGRLVWRASGARRLFGHGTFYATPALAYGRVYIGSTDGRVYSFGAATGRLRWSHHTGGYVYGSAAVWRRLVLVGSYDGRFYAFDAATGDVRWSFRTGGPVSGSATVIDGIAYFATLRGRTYALDARTGRIVWQRRGGKYAPAVADDRRAYVVGYSSISAFVPVPR